VGVLAKYLVQFVEISAKFRDPYQLRLTELMIVATIANTSENNKYTVLGSFHA
jgi:hypothetical protein